MNILILEGGTSPEREVSLRSAKSVLEAVVELGHAVRMYDTGRGLEDLSPLITWADLVFPALHGEGGEDGSIQELLESHQVAFVGTGSAASRNCFNKIAAKRIFEKNALPTPVWEEVNAKSFAASPLIKLPYVLKPPFGGSSIDTVIVRNPDSYHLDMEIFKRHKTLLLEELIVGTELTVGMLGESTLPVVEIIPPEGKEFDYNNKYNGQTQELCPPKNVTTAIQKRAQYLAGQTHRVLDAHHFSRTDIMVSSSGELYILEINTIPGLTEQSLLPKAAQAAGFDMTKLVQSLIEFALQYPGKTD